MSPKAIVAIVGPTGYLGRDLSTTFVKAAKDGEFVEIRLLTPNTTNATLQTFVKDTSGKVKVVQVDYISRESLELALDGVNIIVSGIGGEGREERERNLIRAAAAKGVKIYIPSEWGMDYTKSKHTFSLFDWKRQHSQEAESLGLKTIRFVVPYFIDASFSSYYGADSKTNTWTIPGDGNQLNSFTSKVDIAQYAVRAAVLAFANPTSIPSQLKLYGDSKSWNQCADLMEAASGEKITRNYVPLEELLKAFEETKAQGQELPTLFAAFNLLSAEGLDNFSNEHNELLNPGQKYFKPHSVAEYAKEVNGKPWLTGNPFA